MSFLPAAQHSIYTRFVKPLFFLLDAEQAHDLGTQMGGALGSNKLGQAITRFLFAYSSPELKQKIDGITYPNPVGLPAGFDYNGLLTDILPEVGFGWHTIGTVTYQPYLGNTPPRLGRFPNSQALLVNKGLKSWGAKKVISHLQTKTFRIPTGISIASTNTHFDSEVEQIKDILACFQLFEKSKLKHVYYELNISCPNTFGGEPFTSPKRLERLLTALDKLKIKKPIYIKMPIDQSKNETSDMLHVIDSHHISGVIFGNLTKDHANPDVTPEDRASWKYKKGNLSGKPTWKRSNVLIELTKKEFGDRFTIIGTGGIFSGKDAAIKMEKGAQLIQLISGMIFEGPQVIGMINRYLDQETNRVSTQSPKI